MNLFVTIALLFVIAVVVLWLFWKFDKEEPEQDEESSSTNSDINNEELTQPTQTLVQQIEESNKQFLNNIKENRERRPKEDVDIGPIKMPEFTDLKMFTKHQSEAPKLQKEVPFQGYDRRKLGMMQDSQMIDGNDRDGLMTKKHWSLAQNKIEPRMTLALRMNPELIDSWKQANKGPTIDQGKMVLDNIAAKKSILEKK